MEQKLSLTTRRIFQAPLEKVWDALTNPVLVKQYFFGTELVTNWHVGQPVVWRGTWEGVAYEDKGTVLQFEPMQRVQYNYWSSMSGTEDVPENYANITYALEETPAGVQLTIVQDGIETAEKREHSEQSWQSILQNMADLIASMP
jgi:uncharacterized protein YndB with AHSA1/START domain